MKKKRLGEVLRERGHLSTADLNQILLDQRGKRIHLGELLLQNNKIAKISLTVVMAEPQNLQFLDELRFKSGKKIIPRLGFRSEIALAIDRHHGVVSVEPAGPLAPLASSLEDQGMEFVSFSDQQRNIDAMREMEAELLQKSKATPLSRSLLR